MHKAPSHHTLDNNQAWDCAGFDGEEDVVVGEDVANDVGMDAEKCAEAGLDVHFWGSTNRPVAGVKVVNLCRRS